MATGVVPMDNTYNPRGDAAKLLSYRPNGAIVTDEDGEEGLIDLATMAKPIAL